VPCQALVFELDEVIQTPPEWFAEGCSLPVFVIDAALGLVEKLTMRVGWLAVG
jgi:hypothetical protein